MAKTRSIQSSFVSGVLSPLLRGRIDLDQYHQGLEIGDNVVIVPQGGVKRRPGAEFLQKALPVLARNTTTPTMPEGGTAASINDEDDSTTTTTTTNIGVLDPYVVAKYDLGSATYVEVVDVRQISLTSLTSSEFVIQHSDDDIAYTTAATVPLIGTNAQDFRLFVGATKRYWRLARVGTTDLGTDKVTLADFNLWELTGTLSNVKTLDFSVESDRHYLLVVTDGNMRIFRTPSTHVADVKVPYTSAQVEDLRDTQTENVMVLLHIDHTPQRLINLATDVDWLLDDVPFQNVPQFDYDDSLSPTPTSDVQQLVLTGAGWAAGDTFQIDIEGVLSKNITFAGDATPEERSSTVFNIQKNIQDMPVMGETGVTVTRTGALTYDITAGGESAKAFELYSGFPTSGATGRTLVFTHTTTGVPRKEDVWSSARGYPKTACFYGGRLWFGGTKSKPQSLFGSKAGSFFDFEIGEGNDDEAIFITISSRKLNDIVDVFPGRDLQVFTAGSEFTVNGSTPSELSIVPQTSHGAVDIEVRDVDGATIFADRNGKTLREYVYSFNEDAYISRDISVLASQLVDSPKDMAMLTGTSSEDSNWLMVVNQDGNASILNTLREQDINGFTAWKTSGFITNASVVDEELYMVNKRTVGGVESNFIERWSFNHLMDCSIKKAAAATVTGLDHLEGETVQIVADGSVLPERVVSGGSITLTTAEQAHTNLEIGLNFTCTVKQMPVTTNIGSGLNALRIKKIVRSNILVYETFGLHIEDVTLPIRAFGDASISPLDTAPEPRTGIIEDYLAVAGWTRQEMPEITCPDPTPFHIQMIDHEVESS